MKKIAYIVCNISKVGGTERAVINIANTLSDYPEYEVTIISMYSGKQDQAGMWLSEDVKILHLGLSNSKQQLLFSYVRFLKLMRSIDKKDEFDVVIGTTHAMNSLLSICVNRSKVVACEHTIYEACPFLSRVIRRIAYSRMDAVVLLTNSEAEKYSFVSPQKKYVIPNALSFEIEIPSTLDNKIIVAAGRLSPVKRYDLLIDLASDIKVHLPDWEIRIYGDGECKQELQHRINEYGLESYVSLMGNTNKIADILIDSSIMVMTSRYEGLPMILIEGQACGLPIVSFDCPVGPRNIIDHNHNGYLISEGNNREFVEKVVALAQNMKLRKTFGENAYKASKKYDSKEVASQWLKMFEKISVA